MNASSASLPQLIPQQSFSNILLRHPYLATLILFFLLCMLAAAMIAQERAKQIETLRYQLLQTLTNYASEIEGAVNSGVVALDSIRTELLLAPDADLSRLDARIDLLLHNYSLFRHVAIAPNLVIRYVYPLAGNEEILGRDYRQLPLQMSAIETTLALGRTMVAGPLDLVQGGTAIVVRAPVILENNQRWGVIAAIVPFERFLQTVRLENLRQHYYVGLSGRDGIDAPNELFWGDPEVLAQDSVMADIKLPVGRWQLQAIPRAPVPILFGSLLWFTSFAGCVILLLCVALFLLLRLAREREQALYTIAFQASYDPLTNLPNRLVFTEQLTRMIQQAEQQELCLSVFCIDLDEFKQINESLGHVVGDKLLRAVAQRLGSLVARQDLLARLGGDEFVIVSMQAQTPEQTELMAEHWVRQLSLPVQVGTKSLAVSASIGIAMYPHDGQDHGDLLKHADRAMYAAKQLGRNNYHFYDAEMQKEADRFVHLHNEILEGIGQQQFYLVYQPIYDVMTGRFTKCEALIRWLHPVRGLISPLEFISVAERTGAIRPLGVWILQQALRDLAFLNQQGVTLQLSINRSSHEFNVHHVALEWLKLIEDAGIAPEQVIFEITESLFMDRVSAQQQNIEVLHQRGIQLAIDDFGTGYSALNYLSRYPVSVIKIDKSFIVEIANNDKAKALVAVLINMAKVLDVTVIAEGVETQEQLKVLVELGCDYIQGYLFSKPVKLPELIEFIHQDTQKVQ